MTEEVKELETTRDGKWLNVQIDSQWLSTFMGCPAKFNYVFNRHLIPVGGISPSIERGLLCHESFSAYFTSLMKDGNIREATKAGIKTAKENSLKYASIESELLTETLTGLLEFYKYIANRSWIPLFTEQYFKKVIYEDPVMKLRIILTGRMDLGMRTPQIKLLPIDFKTESERWFYSQMSNQFKIYCIVSGVNVIGVQRVGFQKTLKPEDKYKLELIPYDPDVLEEFRTITLPHYVKELLLCNETSYWPMNHANCVSGHFACQFSDKYHGGICSVSREVREQKLARWFKSGEAWDPKNG